MFTIKRTLRGIIRRPRYSFGLLIAGVLGLSGNLYLDSLQGSIHSSIRSKSRELLTADVSISVRRLTNESERLRILEFKNRYAASLSRSIDLYSMVNSEKGSRLVQLIAIEANYPLVGSITLERNSKSINEGEVWIDPELRDSYGFNIGESLKLGDRKFKITDLITGDTANAWRGFTLAPRMILGMNDLMNTGLIRKGSTLWDRTYFLLNQGVDAREVARNWNSTSEESAIRAISHEEASEQVSKVTGYLNDYLGLVGLTTLFLALVGMSFLFQTELRTRLKMMGTLRALGDSSRRIGFEISLESMLLGLASAFVSILIVYLTLPIASKIVSNLSSVQITPTLNPMTLVLTLLVGSCIGFFLAFPFSIRVGRLKPSALFQDAENILLPTKKADVFLYSPLLVLFYFLSLYQAHSVRVGSIFFLMTLISVTGFYFFGGFIFRFLGKFKFRGISRKLAFRSLSKNRWSSLSGFIAVGVGALLLSLIPALESIISSEIERPEGSRVPSLFLFDIQEEQLSGVKSKILADGAHLDFISPMIRARLESLNGKPVTKALEFSERSTREQEEEERSRNRGFNLSYRDSLSDSESVAEGRDFIRRYDPKNGLLPEVTLEIKFADRLGVKLGEKIGFDIQGIPIEAKIVGLRRVKWSSFQPNFFVLFQPGVLDDAPKTFLAAIPKVPPELRIKLQNNIVKDFPNVSVIQVEEMIKKIVKLFDQMAFAVRVTALLSLLTGVFVLFSIARRQVELRRRSTLLLKAMGASRTRVLSIFLWEFGVLSLLAGISGVGFSFLISHLLAWVLFERAQVQFQPSQLGVIFLVVVISLFAVILASYRLISERPWRLLQADGDR